MTHRPDQLVFRPDDVDLARSPLRAAGGALALEPTYVLGAFNPGLTRLANGNLLAMARIAEALVDPVRDEQIRAVRWSPEGYVLDGWPLQDVDVADPRQFSFRRNGHRLLGLTSLSWLLPVELTPDGLSVVEVHYERAVAPSHPYECYGVEDARISRVEDHWYMTACAVSPERHCTTLYRSDNGLDWRHQGIVLDHQNKDMTLFEGKIGGRFIALTRPLGELYFVYPPGSPFAGGPSINLAQSPDALHWKPLDTPGIRGRTGSPSAAKVGGGAPPILTPQGWLVLYHGVEPNGVVGTYRTFWAVLAADDPSQILRQEDETPLLEADPALIADIAHQAYLPSPAVFTCGMVDAGDHYVVASGEADLACRISHLDKSRFE